MVLRVYKLSNLPFFAIFTLGSLVVMSFDLIGRYSKALLYWNGLEMFLAYSVVTK